MKIVASIPQHAWVSAGVVGGGAVGCAVNLIRTGSWLGKDMTSCSDPFNGFAPFLAINSFREFARGRTGDLTVVAFNPLMPGVYAIPMLAYAVWNGVQEARVLQKTGLKTRANIVWRHISSQVLYPTAYGAACVGIETFMVKVAFRKILPTWIDPSGHIALNLLLTIHAAQYLNGVSRTGTTNQKRLLTGLASLIALTDAIWSYNTAANCHSVADIVFGALATGASLLVLDRGLSTAASLSSTTY